MSDYLGDFRIGATVRVGFNTYAQTGGKITFAGSPAFAIYKDGSTTESTSGVTLTVDYDSRTGYHLIEIDTSSNGTFYSSATDFRVVCTNGTADGIAQANSEVACFSLENRSGLMATTAGRKLDVSAGGEAGLDWANIGGTTTTQNLSGTTIKTATDVETDTSAIETRVLLALPNAAPGTAGAVLIAGSNETPTFADFIVTGSAAFGFFNVEGDPFQTILWTYSDRTITGGTVTDVTNINETNLNAMSSAFVGMIVLDGSVYQYTANALELAPSGGGGGGSAQDAADGMLLTPSGPIQPGSVIDFLTHLSNPQYIADAMCLVPSCAQPPEYSSYYYLKYIASFVPRLYKGYRISIC